MPAFTFEKISPPTNRGSVSPVANSNNKKRGLIVQILDRFVEVRVKRSLRSERSAVGRSKSKTSE